MPDCRERVGVETGPNFVSEAGKNMLVRKALYGSKSIGAASMDFLAETMDTMGYRTSYTEPDLWLWTSVKPNGCEYYEYIFYYVENMLCIYHNPRKFMKNIQEDFKLKDDKIEPPDVYLGATLDNMELESGKYCWTMLPEQYVKAAVTTVEENLSRSGNRLLSKCVTPLSGNYAPWLEDSAELMADGVQQYQELIVQIRWYVEI